MYKRKAIKGFIFRHFFEKNHRMLRLLRSTQFSIWRTRNKLSNLWGDNNENLTNIIHVNPEQITHHIADLPWDRFKIRGRVIGGNWDQAAMPFSGWDLFKAFQVRYIEQRNWNETSFYKRVYNEIQAGQQKWGCSSISQLDARLVKMDELFRDIKDNGFKTQSELMEHGKDQYAWEPDSPFNSYDDVVVCIDRNGKIMLRDGKHRLSIAKILKLEKIPVVVGLRHSRWQEFRKEINDWIHTRDGVAYQPFTHPDLCNIPLQHDDGRYELMSANLSSNRGKLLDIGAFIGYFCHRFESLGLECTAVEYHPKHVYFMKKLRDAECRQFTVHECSILDMQGELKYDVVLALNIFHHFCKSKELHEGLRLLLGRLDAKVMFFEPHCQEDSVMKNAYRNYSPEEFLDFIRQNSCFNESRCLGTVARGRKLYMLER